MGSDSVIFLLSGIGVIQGFLLSAYLFQLKSGKKKSNRLLGLLLLGITIRVGKSVLNYFFELDPYHRNLGLAGFLMVGPSLWLYGRSVLGFVNSKGWKIWIHYLPSALFILMGWLIPNQTNELTSRFIYSLVLLQLLIYLIFSFITASSFLLRKIRLFKWYRNIAIGVLSIWLFYLGIFLKMIPVYIGGAIFYSFLIYCFSYLLLRFHHFNLEKYKGNAIHTDKADSMLAQLKGTLEGNQLFLKNDLTLNEVALRMNISPRKLSQLINEQTGSNFATYINGLRIEEAKRLLQDVEMKAEPISGIAFDSGFSNITSFNQAFKKFTCSTPSTYRKKVLKDS
ncbi:MAG: helix-turn-helix domain-containing protein [Bacteroidota bacterium]